MAALILHEFMNDVRVPLGGDKIYKDECAFSFDNPESDTGLYVCMKTFLGFGKEHVLRHFHRTGNKVYLHLKTVKKKKPKTHEEEEKPKPTRLAIGVEGGFDVEDQNQYEYEENNSVVILPDFLMVPLPNQDIPLKVQQAVSGILAAESASRQEQVASWDGEARVVSKHAENLLQLDNGVKVPPSGWKCSRCDLTDNLWMNLTDGAILCGRRYFDGSGGNNHALEHYGETKYPLAVKLGTITANGADVFSYDEDDMVEDPKLAQHLAHFGINMMIMEKTDKTMTELEIDLNTKIAEWDVIQEAGSKLTPLFGAGYTGIRNLGNSCYLNSVMQVLFTVPDFIQKYANQTEAIFSMPVQDPTSDFNIQMAKLGYGLQSGIYSKEPQNIDESGEPQELSQEGIAPRMLKSLIGRGHPEFSTNRQQDAEEFLHHLFNIIERNSVGSSNPCDCFKFELEERVQCVQSGQVRYKKRSDFLLSLPIPLAAAINKEEVAAYEAKKKELEARKEHIDPKELVRPRIPILACLEVFMAPETVEDFFSSALQAKSIATRSVKFATFPDFLVIQLKKFTLTETWVPKKLDVAVDMPDELDLTAYRGLGLQSGEVELPEGDSPPEPEPEISEETVQQLMDMGFAREGCRKAVYHTKNSGVEAAMNWVLQHMSDTDFAEPLQLGRPKKAPDFVVNEDGVAMILSMGFSRDQAIRALKATDNNVERAADWIFSHLDEPIAMETDRDEAQPVAPKCRDGNGKYRLMAFISHMGTSTSCGHYVCHIFKDGRWVIYNDRKVAISEHPPKDLGYLYVYQRL
ncbi:ubiquitin carboxyl-terminal hydrolase 5-like [Acanthaster planci]|uniref:Ubiquitin carboxyl-terminal hydrolase n=1 Tax=Acanthaster planci TaxID=133434 RepID=A0A8B7Z4S8_ACAPL|nr:ubiquitin carboxyl-terminal hydrolase 5-like [Acanthaster planci]